MSSDVRSFVYRVIIPICQIVERVVISSCSPMKIVGSTNVSVNWIRALRYICNHLLNCFLNVPYFINQCFKWFRILTNIFILYIEPIRWMNSKYVRCLRKNVNYIDEISHRIWHFQFFAVVVIELVNMLIIPSGTILLARICIIINQCDLNTIHFCTTKI